MPGRTQLGEDAFAALNAAHARSDLEVIFARLADHLPSFAAFLAQYEDGRAPTTPVSAVRSLGAADLVARSDPARGEQHRYVCSLTADEHAAVESEAKRLGLASSRLVTLYVAQCAALLAAPPEAE